MSPLNPTRALLIIREYSLPGSYRKIIHLPKTFTWSHVSYTDPDISLVQSDEDKILGENPAAEDDPEGESILPSHSTISIPPLLFCSYFLPSSLPSNHRIIGEGMKADTQANSKHSKSNSPSVHQHTQPWP